MTVSEAVEKGATNMASAETYLLKAQKELATLPAIFAAVRDGDVGLGAQEAQALSAEAKAVAGKIAEAELATVAFHQKLTARATELGIDLPPPSDPETAKPLSGGR